MYSMCLSAWNVNLVDITGHEVLLFCTLGNKPVPLQERVLWQHLRPQFVVECSAPSSWFCPKPHRSSPTARNTRCFFSSCVFFLILSQVLFSAPLLKNRKIETVKKYLLEPTLMSETHWLLAERVKKPIIYCSNTKEWNDSERSHNHPCFLYTGIVLSRRRSLGA